MSALTSPVTTSSIGIAAYAGTGSANPRTIDEAAKAFEQIFVSQMLAQMYTGIENDGPFSGGPSEDIYRSLMTEEYGAIITERGGIGIADALKRQLLALQEVSQ